jgi:thiamine-phosphate pyrophosphorylase
MSAEERAQIYLITPPVFAAEDFAPRLAAALDAVPVACVRLAMAGSDEVAIARAADSLREIAHARDVALVVERHVLLAARHGLDGVHLPDGARSIRFARKELGPDAIVGAACGNTRHEGLAAAEAGADYVSFGPVAGSLGSGALAPRELFEWWSEMIEVPVVAEGGLDTGRLTDLAQVTDFFGLGEEIWRHDDPAAELRRLEAFF